mgnify:CR=1 FL=1
MVIVITNIVVVNIMIAIITIIKKAATTIAIKMVIRYRKIEMVLI